MIEIWKTTDLDRYVAEELFGWKWIAFHGHPIRGRERCTPPKCKVRQFFPPDIFKNERWKEHFENSQWAPATGDEPLAYCYCSSMGPHTVPHFSGHEHDCVAMEKEIRKRKLWKEYRECLAGQIGSDDEERLHFANCESRCIAALAAVGSKYVFPDESNDQGPERIQ